jgi:hypothetical protein
VREVKAVTMGRAGTLLLVLAVKGRNFKEMVIIIKYL